MVASAFNASGGHGAVIGVVMVALAIMTLLGFKWGFILLYLYGESK
jgi:hypothetical protein